MILSLRAIEFCKMKLGRGQLCGFEQLMDAIPSNIIEEEAKQAFDELTKNEIVILSEDEIHISALGQHIFNMMIEPEQYILIENMESNLEVRIYIRNTYYLCVITDNKAEYKNENRQYLFELLPKVDLIIGSFVYAMQHSEKQTSIESMHSKQPDPAIRITGKAWNKDREINSELSISGYYNKDNIVYQFAERRNELDCGLETFESDQSELINRLTRWMFEKISATNESEVF